MPMTPAGPELAAAAELFRTGRIREAAERFARLPDRSTAAGELVPERVWLGLGIALAVGDLRAAGVAGEGLRPALGGSDSRALLARLGWGELTAALGEHEQAADHYLAAGALPGADTPTLPSWRSGAAIALVHTGRRQQAAELSLQLLRRAEESAQPHALAVALRTVAIAAPGSDPFAALRRARGLAVAAPDLRLAAQIDVDLAALLLLVPAGASVEEAVGLLRRAEEYARTEGLRPLHGRIARLLTRAGERPRSLHEEVLARLTPSERRVARLAAQGLSNRQIADRLSVTIKAVEWHLSRTYRKLGIDSRAGLDTLLITDDPTRSATA